MHTETKELIYELNPWLRGKEISITESKVFIKRLQTDFLMQKDWDKYCTVLLGPRQSGKTTFGKYLAKLLISQQRFNSFLYINCDFLLIREWLNSPLFIKQALEQFSLDKPIIFLDEVQRLENPGLLLKGVIDLKYPIKLIVSGSSQLEIKSKVQEYLTGRNLEAIILPFSYVECGSPTFDLAIYGCYPAVVLNTQKEIILKRLYQDYVEKDIIEILKIGKPDVMQKLITLLAHSSGQLVNYNQLATDCRVSVPMIHSYCDVLEKTYMVRRLSPFVGNKRKEIVSNPVYYFIDNGFRNQALRDLSLNESRSDIGLLIENAVFQEILKFKEQNFFDFDIHFWRTQSGAEIDFILYKNDQHILPIEVKYRNMNQPNITKSIHSFIDAYKIPMALIITKDYIDTRVVDGCEVKFIPFSDIIKIGEVIKSSLAL